MKFRVLFALALVSGGASFSRPVVTRDARSAWSLSAVGDDGDAATTSRRRALARAVRDALVVASAGASVVGVPAPALAARPTTNAGSGALPDLPPEAVRSYLQYRTPLQVSADYYLFDLRDQIDDPSRWGEVGQVFVGSNARGGQGQPSQIERNFVNPMRILGLSMPPEEADELRRAQFDFERAMARVSKATQGVRRDLPVELDPAAVPAARQGWEEGRAALNDFFTVLNDTTGLRDELRTIPPLVNGDVERQLREYGRSSRKYNELIKKTRLCQNRGGPTLSAAWGQLMVSGYMQDSCGIPDMELYFFQ